ncbi:MAG: PHP domain-containing protein [Defluviitaleaceae bacterium]|nr:PHP domain-containing protein [Defluviitaleaceae bacterium]
MYVDLHIHSQHSDGTYSMAEIIDKAKSQNITTLSICDHECIDVYAEIKNIGPMDGITIIPGVEITADLDGTSYHILAYAFDLRHEPLQDLLRHNRSIYADMGNKLIANMAKDYPNLSTEEFQSYQRNRKNGGWESIDYLRSKGFIHDWESYIGLAAKYASPSNHAFFSAQEVINTVHEANGYAVLAHLCHHVKLDFIEYEKKAMQFYDMGIDGFECYYPTFPPQMTQFLVDFCNQRGLMITAGSDDHGGFIGAPKDEYYMGAIKRKVEDLVIKRQR